MTGFGDAILSDPHKLSWLLLMGFGFVGLAALAVSKTKRPGRPGRVGYHKQYDISKKPDEVVQGQD